MKKLILLFILIFCAVMIFAQENNSYNQSMGEVRGIWINSDKMPKTKKEAIIQVKEYYDAGFNLLFPEVMCRGYAIYDSKLLERDPRFKECDDVLTTIIDTAHSLSMEVHPWVWCFRAGYTDHPGAIITTHPDWLEQSKYGDTLSVNGGMWISPVIPETREFLINIYKEIATNYDIDGFHLDYIRYETQNPILYGYSNVARKAFRYKYFNIDPLEVEYLSPEYRNWIEFRESFITSFVEETSKALKECKPYLTISAAVAADPIEARLNYMQNWPYWAEKGYVDMIVPMTYMTDDKKFSNLMKKQLAKIDGKVFTTVGIGSHLFTKEEWKNTSQIRLARETEYMGQALFAAQYMTSNLEEMLAQTVWQDHASLPFWKENKKTEAIKQHKNNINEFLEPEPLKIYFPKNILPIQTYHAKEKYTNIIVDGLNYGNEWDGYETVKIEYDNMGKSVPYTTDVKMTYDDEAVYISYTCYEPTMYQLKAEALERDGYTFYDDSVEVFIQMLPSVPKYNHFSVNTLNTHFDQQMYNVAWSKEWKSQIQLNQDSWDCEIKIPYKEMGVSKPKKGDFWRMNFTRNRWTTGECENLAWSVPYGSFHTPERFGYVYFE